MQTAEDLEQYKHLFSSIAQQTDENHQSREDQSETTMDFFKTHTHKIC